ncbi:MAG: hypothetical protein ACRECH_16450 [Nitrososphaerales archaeon]
MIDFPLALPIALGVTLLVGAWVLWRSILDSIEARRKKSQDTLKSVS